MIWMLTVRYKRKSNYLWHLKSTPFVMHWHDSSQTYEPHYGRHPIYAVGRYEKQDKGYIYMWEGCSVEKGEKIVRYITRKRLRKTDILEVFKL